MNYRIQHLFEGMTVGAFMIAENHITNNVIYIIYRSLTHLQINNGKNKISKLTQGIYIYICYMLLELQAIC